MIKNVQNAKNYGQKFTELENMVENMHIAKNLCANIHNLKTWWKSWIMQKIYKKIYKTWKIYVKNISNVKVLTKVDVFLFFCGLVVVPKNVDFASLLQNPLFCILLLSWKYLRQILKMHKVQWNESWLTSTKSSPTASIRLSVVNWNCKLSGCHSYTEKSYQTRTHWGGKEKHDSLVPPNVTKIKTQKCWKWLRIENIKRQLWVREKHQWLIWKNSFNCQISDRTT